MEPEASRAAISAIAALQKRIRELEEEKTTLETEVKSLHSQIEEKNGKFLVRERELQETTIRAKEIISSSSFSLTQIQKAREENEQLKIELQEAEDQYQKAISEKIRKPSSQQINILLRQISDYEIIFGDIVEQTQKTQMLPCNSAILQQLSSDPDLLPQPLRDIVKQLRKLPSTFQNQSITTKRAMVQGICCAREQINRLSDSVRDLHSKIRKQTPRKLRYEIQTLSAQADVLIQEVSRFHFQ